MKIISGQKNQKNYREELEKLHKEITNQLETQNRIEQTESN